MKRYYLPVTFSRWLFLFLNLSLAAILSACGGGAGTQGLPTGTALYTTAPSAVTVAAGAKLAYTIGGGTPIYSAASSNKDVVTASASGTSLNITGVAGGSANITVTDAAGTAVNLAVTVSVSAQPPGTTPPILFTTAAGSLTVAPGATSTYTVGGGVPAYVVSSSNNSVATATGSGTTFSVTGVATGTADVVVTDAAGTALTLAVKVGGGTAPSALFTTAPSNITVAIDANATFSLGGGTPPYSASTSNAGVTKVATNGSAILITGVSAGTAQVVLADSAGATISVGVTVGASATETALFLTAPDAVTLAANEIATYTIGGGKPAYSVSSSNTSVARVTGNGSSLTITGAAAGSAIITVTDAAGAASKVAVTVGAPPTTPPAALFTTASAAVNVAPGASASYSIGGGMQPYSVSSSNTAVATVSLSGTNFTITGVANGTAEIVVTDATGATTKVALTVSAPQPPSTPPATLFTTAAGSLSVAPGATSTYGIGGGTTPYAVSSSNTAVATVSLNGSNFSVTGVANGTAEVVVTDAAGTALTLAVKVGGAAPSVLFTTAPSNVTVAVGANATFAMGGGTAPYTATSGNTGVVTTAINGSAILITGVSPGAAMVLLADSAGATITVDVTVGGVAAGTSLFLTAPEEVSLAVNEVGAYTIGGGKPAYSVSTSNSSVATAAVNGSNFSITAVAPGTAKVTVTDVAGTARIVDVTVSSATQPPATPPSPTVSPESATGNVGDTLTFLISSGTPGFTVTLNNPSIATLASASGNSFSVKLNNVGQTSANITDAAGKTVTLPISVNQTTTTLRLSPSALLIGENVSSTVALNIYGGTGPYRAFTSDATLSSVSINGAILSVDVGSNLNRCINPITSDGTYIPNGTFDVTITTLDSLGASATSIMTIQDNGKGLSTGCP